MSGETIGAWLATRTPPAPEPLRVALHEALGDDALARPRAEAPERCLAAAEQLLARVVRSGDGRDDARGVARALLAVDALVTYAFEAAADEPARLRERAEAAMRSLAAFASAAA